jgi:hypothetical protein
MTSTNAKSEIANDTTPNKLWQSNQRKGVTTKMYEYLLLALLYGGLAASYLVLALRIRS